MIVILLILISYLQVYTANRMLTQAAMDCIKSANYHWRKSGIELKVHL